MEISAENIDLLTPYIVLIMQPSSAAAERVFSTLSNPFSSQQKLNYLSCLLNVCENACHGNSGG